MRQLLLVAASIIALTSAAHAKPYVCEKDPEAKWGCFWTKGVVSDSADAGDVIGLQEHGDYILDKDPEALHNLIGAGSTYIVGDYLFCPFSPRLHEPAGVYNLEWRYYGCVESFKNTTVIRMIDIHASSKELAKRICALVDCSRPGFSDFREDAKSK